MHKCVQLNTCSIVTLNTSLPSETKLTGFHLKARQELVSTITQSMIKTQQLQISKSSTPCFIFFDAKHEVCVEG